MPRTVWALGLVSFLMDVSSEMIHACLPLFMAQTLGASAVWIGLVEGGGESAALIVKVFSGWFADRFGHRKALVFTGYALSVLSKPVFALAGAMPVVLGARIADRIGKGVRGAPRDAILADAVPAEIKGAAFGLRQSLDAAGAFAGPAIAALLLWLTLDDFRLVFYAALIPGILCLLMIILGVEDPKGTDKPRRTAPNPIAMFKTAPPAFRQLVLVGVLFSLAKFSNAFIVLRAADAGMANALIPLLMVGMNLVFSMSAYPFGVLADRVKPVHLLAIGLVLLILSDLAFALPASTATVLAGTLLWGLHLGATQGIFSLLTAQTAPAEARATAFGVFSFFSGLALLAAGLSAGVLWEVFGATYAFAGGAVFAALCGIVLMRSRFE